MKGARWLIEKLLDLLYSGAQVVRFIAVLWTGLGVAGLVAWVVAQVYHQVRSVSESGTITLGLEDAFVLAFWSLVVLVGVGVFKLANPNASWWKRG